MTKVEPFQRFHRPSDSFDWFMLPFDKRGRCMGPQTRAHLMARAADPSITDVFVFSHGWNNDWNVATRRYRSFIDGYLALRRDRGLPVDRPMRPLLIGVFWPSTALVFGSERGIEIAAGRPTDAANAIDVEEFGAELSALTEEIDVGEVERFYALVEKDVLSRSEGEELAQILAPVLDRKDDETPSRTEDDGDDMSMVDLWESMPPVDGSAAVADADSVASVAQRLDDFGRGGSSESLAGAGVGKLDPRQIVRLATVQTMKDRAGRVGARGLGSFLVDLLAASDRTKPRVHMVGHSYGAKVCLSALCYPADLPRPVDSLLLLQPAVSHRCFADDGEGRGGYADAPVDRVDLPILSTFSRHDIPLGRFFPYVTRRKADRDEARIAGGRKPSPFAALGGVGPHGLGDGAKLIDVRLPSVEPKVYDLGKDAPAVYGIDATSTIDGHGSIDNDSTHWALDNLVAAPRRTLP